MRELYLELIMHQDKLNSLIYDPVKKQISYKEQGRLYFIEKIGNWYFLHTEGIQASEFEGKEQIKDFLLIGLK